MNRFAKFCQDSGVGDSNSNIAALPIALAGLLIACGVEEAEWTRPVGADVHRITYAPIPDADRYGTIHVTRELVIGTEDGDFNYLFGTRAPHVSVDSVGRVFVADPTNLRVQVYDANGTYVRTIGRSGEGPGEFAFPYATAVAGPFLYVSDTQRSRLSRWSLDGVLDWDRPVNVFPGYLIPPVVGLNDGTWLIRFRPPRTDTMLVAHMSTDGTRTHEIAPLAVPGRTGYGRHMIYVGSTPPQYAADRDGNVYVSALDEYQVFSYGLDGAMRWALQVPTHRSGIADSEKEWAVRWFRDQGYADVGKWDVDWPDRAYALADVKVDGHGRVYVFPYVPRGTIHDRLPVDVYAPDGARIMAGWLDGDLEGTYWTGGWKPGPMLGASWQTTRGDKVYGVLEDPETGVYMVVRQRIEFPAAENRP